MNPDIQSREWLMAVILRHLVAIHTANTTELHIRLIGAIHENPPSLEQIKTALHTLKRHRLIRLISWGEGDTESTYYEPMEEGNHIVKKSRNTLSKLKILLRERMSVTT